MSSNSKQNESLLVELEVIKVSNYKSSNPSIVCSISMSNFILDKDSLVLKIKYIIKRVCDEYKATFEDLFIGKVFSIESDGYIEDEDNIIVDSRLTIAEEFKNDDILKSIEEIESLCRDYIQMEVELEKDLPNIDNVPTDKFVTLEDLDKKDEIEGSEEIEDDII